MSTILLTTPSTVAPENRGVTRTDDGKKVVAEGLATTGSYTDRENVTNTWERVHHVEQVPARLYNRVDVEVQGVVVPINGRMYRVRIAITLEGGGDEYGYGIPERAHVSFTTTNMHETPYKTWDAEAEKAKLLASYRRDLAETEDLTLVHVGTSEGEWVEQELTRIQKQITDLEAGSFDMFPRSDVVFFGVPQFIQNPIFPALDGKAAQCLAVLNTDWGDCGNINILFACDADGVPCKVWFEASCC